MSLKFKNNASTTLSGSINNSQTSITVISAASFPVLSGADVFYATLYEVSGSVEINIEIVKVTATSGNVWTVVRAQDGTSARARDGITTCYIELRMTAAGAGEFLQLSNNLSDLASASTARTNLGLGTMATQNASAVAITGGTISGVSITSLDSTTTLQDNVDTSKQLQFELSGITTGNTRVLTIPNASGTLALVSDLTSGYQPLDSDLTAIAALAANGLIARTGTGTVAVRTITAPAAGITITNPDGVSGNPTLVLANDLAAVEGLATTGFVRRTGAETWSASAIVDSDLPSALTGKTYNALTLTSNATGFSLAGGTTSKTLTVSNSITLAGTDGTTITLPSTTGTVALNNQTVFIGTTGIAINRTTGALSLTGVSIDGSAGSATTATTATKSTNLVGGNTTTLLGSIGYQSGVDTTTLLSPNTTATKQFLSQTGTGTNGAAPVWSTVSKSDVGLANVENTALTTWTGTSTLTTVGTIGSGTWQGTAVGIAYGGTGAATKAAGYNALTPITTLGDLVYGDGANSATRLAGNTTTTRKFVRQTGNGTVSAAPAWDTLIDGDIPTALTGKTYNALTLTAAATGFTIAGGTTSKTLTVSNTLTLQGTDASTLNIGTGGTLGSAAFTNSTAYAPSAGSSSITTVGTIASGTWNGGTIGISYGGTGSTTATAGFNALSPATALGDLIYRGASDNVRLAGNITAAKQFLTQTGTGAVSAAPAWGAIADGDLPSALTGKTYNGLTHTANAIGFSMGGGTTAKTLTVSNNLTLQGTDGSTLNIGGGGTLGTGAYATIANYMPLAGGTFTGNVVFNGTGLRITGDLSNATASSRLLVQTSTVNGNTNFGIIPNGTSTNAQVHLFGTSDPNNAPIGIFTTNSSVVQIQSTAAGTGTLLPFRLMMSATEVWRASTGGKFLVGGTTDDGVNMLQVTGGTSISGALSVGGLGSAAGLQSTGSSTPASGSGVEILGGASGVIQGYNRTGGAYINMVVDGLSVALKSSGTTRAFVDSTGLAVTGQISASGRADFTLASTGRVGTFAGSGDRLRVFVNAASSGATIDVTDSGETTTARPLNIGGSNGTINLGGTTAVVSSTGVAVTGAVSTTGQITTSNVAGNTIFEASTATTNAKPIRIANTGGNAYFGVESSAGGSFLTGAAAYSFVINNVANTPIHFATNNTLQATLDTSGNLTFQSTGSAVSNVKSINGGQLAGLRNRIINGAMQISQYGTSNITANTSDQFPVDRFKVNGSVTSKFTAQYNQGAVTPATGFSAYLGCTSSSAYTVPTGEAYSVNHLIEGLNVADLAWGTASAKTVTLSFWVRSSLTGTFGGVVRNSGLTRSYPFSYTISAANTWEYKTITIAGDTTGTWLNTNGIGIGLVFSLGAGASLLGTAGSWAAAGYYGASGQTNVVATNAATWYITGVQFEMGSVATPFEQRSAALEQTLCQRYYEAGWPGEVYNGAASAQTVSNVVHFKVTKRATPTCSVGVGAIQNATSSAFSSYQGSIASGTWYAPTSFTATAEL